MGLSRPSRYFSYRIVFTTLSLLRILITVPSARMQLALHSIFCNRLLLRIKDAYTPLTHGASVNDPLELEEMQFKIPEFGRDSRSTWLLWVWVFYFICQLLILRTFGLVNYAGCFSHCSLSAVGNSNLGFTSMSTSHWLLLWPYFFFLLGHQPSKRDWSEACQVLMILSIC